MSASLTVRPVRCEERARWRQLMNAHHYLGFRPIVGQSLWYLAEAGGHPRLAKRGLGYVPHGQPKWVLVHPLRPQARESLTAAFLPPCRCLRKETLPMIDVNRLPLEGEGGLIGCCVPWWTAQTARRAPSLGDRGGD